MGIVRMGAPTELAVLLRNEFDIGCFVETGTFEGSTTYWAAHEFSRVITIEAAEPIFQRAKGRLANFANVEMLYGDSVQLLPGILNDLHQPTIFWLDGHWCGMDSYKGSTECPLLAEIDALNNFTRYEQIVLIDDARLFLSPPPSPHVADQWPSIDKILERLKSKSSDRYIVVFEDVIIDTPLHARSLLIEYCQRKNTIWWEERGSKTLRKGFEQICNGIDMIAASLFCNRDDRNPEGSSGKIR